MEKILIHLKAGQKKDIAYFLRQNSLGANVIVELDLRNENRVDT